ncbi:MAG: hypothetical protein IJS78_07045 [Clostridia bacterium]|nr:hypothetical protein [Clostridia bacterium]
MVGKLFKYEFKYYLRWLIPIMSGCVVLALTSKLFYLVRDVQELYLITQMVYSTYTMLIGAAVVLGYVIVALRFLKSTFTQEAYFTHTIPVKPSTLLNVKFASGALFMIVIIAGAVGSFIMMFTGSVFSTVTKGVADMISSAFRENALGNFILGVFEVILLSLLVIFVEILHPYAACAIGQRMKSKTGGAIMWYFIIFAIIRAGSTLFMIGNLSWISALESIEESGRVVPTVSPHLIMWIYISVVLAVDLTFYFITRHRLKKKLNIT